MASTDREPPPYSYIQQLSLNQQSQSLNRTDGRSISNNTNNVANLEQSHRYTDLNEFTKGHNNLVDVYIAVMGCTGAGKSSFIGKCTGKEVVVGHNLVSCTIDVKEYSFTYRNQYNVHLIDTPGFDDTTRSDAEVLRDVAGWLGSAYQQNILLAGIIYLHRISDPRMTGTARRNLGMFKKLCGEECYSKVILATTFWSMVPAEQGDRRELELLETKDFWGYMASKGSTVMRHTGERDSALKIIQHILNLSHTNENVPLAIQKEMVDQGVELNDTSAGRSVDEELRKQRERYEREIRIMEKEKEDLLRERDEESARELEETQREYREKLAKSESSSEALRVNLETLQADMLQKLRDLEQEVEQRRIELDKMAEVEQTRSAQSADNLADFQEKDEELQRQRKGLFGKVARMYQKGNVWLDNNPKNTKQLKAAGNIAARIAVQVMSRSHPAAGLVFNALLPTPSLSTSVGGGSNPGNQQPTQPMYSERASKPSAQSPPPPGQSQQQNPPQPPPQQYSQPAPAPAPAPNIPVQNFTGARQTPTDKASRTTPIQGPNPLGLPLTGTIGVDIILDKFGEQAAWKMGSIWPGPNISCRFQDASWPDDLRRFCKSRDEVTGVWYWVRPFTGCVRGGVWAPI